MESGGSVRKRAIFPRFTEEDDEKLIFEVSKREELYRLDAADYKKFEKKDREWEKIGEKLGKTGEQCKKRWKNIRDNYNRNHARKEEFCEGEEKATKRKRAHYWEILSFLEGIEPERRGSRYEHEEAVESEGAEQDTKINITNVISAGCTEEESNANYYLEFDETDQLPTFNEVKNTTNTSNRVYVGMLKESMEGHKKLVQCIEKLVPPKDRPTPENDVDLFFKTMAATVRKFTPKQITQVKMEIFNVVSKVEMSNHS